MLFYQESRTQSEFVYHKSVPIEEDERSWFFMNIEKKVKSTSEIIREEIVKSPSSFSRWPPYLEEISKGVVIPTLLQLFIETLLSKNHSVSQRIPHLTNSIGQDIIYYLTKRKQKTVKHVQLGIVTKRKTDSKFMTNSLNRFVH